jgi:hypothetical protein
MFEEFTTAPAWQARSRLKSFIQEFEAWRREVPGATLDDVDQPRVGNPWGYNMDGPLVVEPAFEYHFLALRIRDLVADMGAARCYGDRWRLWGTGAANPAAGSGYSLRWFGFARKCHHSILVSQPFTSRPSDWL